MLHITPNRQQRFVAVENYARYPAAWAAFTMQFIENENGIAIPAIQEQAGIIDAKGIWKFEIEKIVQEFTLMLFAKANPDHLRLEIAIGNLRSLLIPDIKVIFENGDFNVLYPKD